MSRFLKWLGLASSVQQGRPRRRTSWRPEIEPLEDRLFLSTSPLPAPHHPKAHVRAQSSIFGLAALNFGLAHLGQSVTLPTTPNKYCPDGCPFYNAPVIWTPSSHDPSVPNPKPAGALDPVCANFVWAALQGVGAKTFGDFNQHDSTTGQPSLIDYKWGDLVLTYKPGKAKVSSLSAVEPGDVLQFRDVGTRFGPIVQHTAIVVRNLGNGRLLVVQQNFANQTWVTSDPTLDVHDFNTYSGGTVWVYRPVAADPC
jgi:hypothetical protein